MTNKKMKEKKVIYNYGYMMFDIKSQGWFYTVKQYLMTNPLSEKSVESALKYANQSHFGIDKSKTRMMWDNKDLDTFRKQEGFKVAKF
jgi:hypothetical protein